MMKKETKVNKRKKIRAIMITMMVLVGGLTTTVQAATFSNLVVTKLVDGETKTVSKYEEYTEAIVNVTYMSQAGKDYTVFVENEFGINTTFATAFNAPCTIRMPYNRPVYSEGAFEAKMNISTAINNFTTGSFNGSWTPNYNGPF